MTTNQTIDGVPRELLALLDATAETVDVHEVQWNSIHGPEGWKVVDAPEYHRCTGPLWDRRITRKPAARPQGKPVAYADPKAFENFGTLAHLGGLYAREWMWANPAPGLVPLYAEQPAPVAVPRLEMAHVVRAHMEIPGCPVLTSNQCHALAMKLNESLKPSL
ncbi:hypothetical protein [Pseudomonas veronii]